VLESLLKEWHKDPSNKVLIFTKSVKLLEMLEFHLRTQRTSVARISVINTKLLLIPMCLWRADLAFVKLDGSTKQAERTSRLFTFFPRSHIVIV
jgi:DNA excision repair protein ERCC-6-like 2